MGLLKGMFQSLKEIRIQLLDARRHMIIIMWARVCIVLHNLIIRIKGNNFDKEWRDGLVRTGLVNRRADDTEEEVNLDNELECVQRRLETPGQRFRLRLINKLFKSHFCNAEHCPQ
jgi:hypothetical protein